MFCTIAVFRIKCVTEPDNFIFLLWKNLNLSFSTWLTHLILRFLYILCCSGPRCDTTRIIQIAFLHSNINVKLFSIENKPQGVVINVKLNWWSQLFYRSHMKRSDKLRDFFSSKNYVSGIHMLKCFLPEMERKYIRNLVHANYFWFFLLWSEN